jgi:acetolactate decarboxylase
MIKLFENQAEVEWTGAKGTLVGLWSPKQYQGTTVAGIHCHFVDSEKARGGHVLDTEIESGTLDYHLYDRLEVQLPFDKEFLHTDLNYNP